MKQNALIAALLVLTAGNLSAQMDRGNFMIGSTVGFSTAQSNVSSNGNSTEGLSAQQLNIAPAIGYFLVDNFAAGLGADYTLNSVTEPNEDKTEDSDVLFGPFLRYYLQAGDNVAFFFVGNFGFGNSNNEQSVGEDRQKISTNVFAVGAGPGITVYSKGGFGIEAILKYNYAQSEFETNISGVNTTTQTRTNQFSLSLGLQYYFGGFRSARG